MTKYFSSFPTIKYNLDGVNGTTNDVTDIFRRVKARSKIADNVTLFDNYDVHEGEKPEDVAYKIYGEADYFWVVTLVNNIVNRYYDWPLDSFSFQEYVKDKYSNPDGIHHYEVTQSSGKQTGDGPADYSHKLEVNSDYPGAQSVSNREYEQRIQDEKRQIRVLLPRHLPIFEDEFRKLIRR
tara:strand:- start:1513 stop:2055 length:543 start_codon:yes stop_codon:yes gene_type:complete